MRLVPLALTSAACALLAAEVPTQCPSASRVSLSPLVTGRGTGTAAPGSPSSASPSSPSPGGPSTPGPGGPSTPRAGGPWTPRGAVTPTGGRPGVGGIGGPTSPRGGGVPAIGGVGAPMEFTRGKTSLDRLEIEWDYPVPPDAESQALSFTRAFEAVRGDDPRPMIVLRECDACLGTSAALLDAAKNDERTKLMTRWFHCVRLPNHTWDPTHPFSELFAQTNGAHLFIASADGSIVIPFTGVQPRPALWRAMHEILQQDYKGDSKRTLSKLVKHLDVYDRIDAKIEDSIEQSDRALEHFGPKSSKYARAQKRLERDRAELEKAVEREQRIGDLGLRRKADD